MIKRLNEDGYDRKHTQEVYSQNQESIKGIKKICFALRKNGYLEKIEKDLTNFNYDPDSTDFDDMYTKIKDSYNTIMSLVRKE